MISIQTDSLLQQSKWSSQCLNLYIDNDQLKQEKADILNEMLCVEINLNRFSNIITECCVSYSGC